MHGRHAAARRGRLRLLIILGSLAAGLLASLQATPAASAPVLTIEPITWNVIGLTSVNSQMLSGVGPDTFLVGARVCNTGDAAATNVDVDLVWDSASAYIDVVPGSPSTLTLPSLGATDCQDFYFNVEIVRSSSAYDASRDFHIEATADGLGAVSTPTPRELYVESLIKQSRNTVECIGDGTATSCSGGVANVPPTTTVYVGQTYTYRLFSDTAPGGYEELSTYLDFSNVIFQVLSVDQTYTEPPGATNDITWADACGWVSDPNDSDYFASSPPNDECAEPDNYAGGKAGGSVMTTYTVKILSGGTTTVNALIYDFSGSSFHYNEDFGSSWASVEIEAIDQADLSITKADDPDPVTVGDQVTYTLDVANAGPSDATNVTVTDTLPAGVSFDTASPSQGSCAELGGVVTCDLGTIASGGTASIDITVTTEPGSEGTITNDASVSADEDDPDPSDNDASEDTTVLASAGLGVGKTDDVDPVLTGDPVTYTVTVSNAGPSDATNVTVTDTLPAGVSFDTASPTQGSCAELGGVVTCDLGTIASGGTASIDITVTTTAPGVITNTVAVTSDEPDPDPSDNDASEDTTIVDESADLSISKTDGRTAVTAGTSTTYTITLTNDGPSTVPPGVVVSDDIPAGTTGAEDEADCVIAAGTLTCTTSVPLDPGESQTWELDLTVPPDYPDAQLTNTASIDSSPIAEVDPSNDEDTDVDDVETLADLSITKDDEVDPVGVGDPIAYTIVVRNDGPSAASGVTVIDALPAGVAFVSASPSQGSCGEAAGVVTCLLGDLGLGATATIDLAVTATTVGVHANLASVSGEDPDPDPTNNDDGETTTVVAIADIVVSKTAAPTTVAPGETLTYTIEARNDGPDDATSLVLRDVLPADLTYVSSTATAGSYDPATGRWTIDYLAAQQTERLTIVTRVLAGSTGELENRVWVAALDQIDPDPTSDSDVAAITVRRTSGTAGTGIELSWPLRTIVVLMLVGSLLLAPTHRRHGAHTARGFSRRA